ncbi:MAG: ATP-binding protein [Ilumatobacter sp.]
MSLRSRLAILFGLVGLIASGLVGGFSFRSTANELEQSTDRFLEERIDQLVQAFRDGDQLFGANEDERGGRRTPRGGFDGGRPVAADDSIIQVTGPLGRSTSSSRALPSTEKSEAAVLDSEDNRSRSDVRYEDIVIDGEPHRMASVGLAGGSLLQVARSTDEDEEVRQTLLRRFVVITILVAATAAAVGWFIARRTTAPLRRLTDVAAGVATTRDFTTDVGDVERPDEIGQLASSFRTMLDALEASRVQQHRLIHDAGHELRTPLTSLRANAALLERAADLPAADRAEVTAAISSELVELSALFDEMIELATDQHDAELVRAPVDLHDLVEEVAARWRRRSGRDVQVQLVRPPTEPSVDGEAGAGPDQRPSSIVSADPSMLERAVGNLVSNAVKFSPAGTPIRIEVGRDSVGVHDQGPGVPVDERERIFGRFYRSESTRSMPGSGLGLSIVAQIVDRHGGSTWVRESPDGGADIGFRLPVG